MSWSSLTCPSWQIRQKGFPPMEEEALEAREGEEELAQSWERKEASGEEEEEVGGGGDGRIGVVAPPTVLPMRRGSIEGRGGAEGGTGEEEE